MSGDEREILLEAVASAARDRNAEGRLLPPAAWWDLPPDARETAFDLQSTTRELERALDESGLSGTARAVLAAI